MTTTVYTPEEVSVVSKGKEDTGGYSLVFDKTNTFRVGAGRAVIKLPTKFFPVEGFNGIHDELCARVLLLHNGPKVAIVSLELTSLPTGEIDSLQKLVGAEAGLPPENVWICATHTFSAPHIRSEELLKTETDRRKNVLLRQAIRKALREAAFQAISGLTDARFGVDTGHCSVNVNRDIPTAQGWWLGSNESGPSDKSVTVLRFERPDGEPIAFLFSHGVQSSVMDGSIMADGGRLVSADLAGAASRYVEREYDDSVTALFCVGAAGDQAPAYKARYMETDKTGCLREEDIHEQGFIITALLGKRLGAAVVLAAEKIECSIPEDKLCLQKRMFKCSGQEMPQDIQDIRPTTQYDYLPAGEREVSMEVMKLGDVVLLGVQPELCCRTFLELKERSLFPHTVVFTLVNGSAKYMAEEAAYRRITYEAMNSSFAVGAAELLRDKALELFQEM
jgi:neutral ceramidase